VHPLEDDQLANVPLDILAQEIDVAEPVYPDEQVTVRVEPYVDEPVAIV